ncbi:MAG TPA: ABC transporter permease [Gemmatimonadales bacterium]|jgi:predicted permease|nr:ABC transporter permease [Gemmatimonadales bacterium]
MREWLARLRDWLRRDQLDRELTEELRFHRERLEREARDAGADPEAARYAAGRRLGSVVQAQEASRDRWSWPWLDHFQKDVRYALRGLRRSPGFTATVVLTLGLGIGANAAMFSVIDRLMFRPYPMLRDPARVHRVYLQWNERERTRIVPAYEYARYLDLARGTRSFSQYAGFAEAVLAVGSGALARERQVATVSATFFDFFDVRPALGRFFGAAEDVTPLGAPVVVLSHAFWQAEFGGRDVIGQTLSVQNLVCTIIGVAPRGFVGVPGSQPPALFMPITTYAGSSQGPDDRVNYYKTYHWGWMSMMVRRKPGVNVEAAGRDLSQAYLPSWNAERLEDPRLPPAEIAKPIAMAGALKVAAGPRPGLEARTLLWLTGVAVIVLLIACANVTNLMFARVLRRRREISVRLALGVSRARLVAQSLTESLLLAGLGCCAGILFAQWGGAALRRLFLPADGTLEVLADWRTLAVASACALSTGLLTGLGPALLAVRGDLAGGLKAGAREGTQQRSRLRAGLLILQGALSVILLVGAGLFVRSLQHVRGMRLGYDAEQVLLVRRNLRGAELDDSSLTAMHQRLLTTAQTVPGVEHAAFVSSIPFWSTSSTSLFVAGIDSVGRLGRFTFQLGTPDYFPTMGTRILRGRSFGAVDRPGTPRVAVVSEGMARVLWPGRDALGQCIRVSADTMPCTTVVGIAEDAVQNSVTEEQHLRYYLPLEQVQPAGGHSLLLRMRGNPAVQVEPVRKALQAVMPGETYVTVRPLSELVAGNTRSWQVGATMFVAFGGLALLVAAIGLYGVVSYNVAQRMHELGVRIALGAQTADVVRLVIGQGIRFAVVGVVLGLGVALLLAKPVEPLLFQQTARDPATYGLVAGLLLLVALVASAVPARRATRADPNTALRSE